jgi:Carboxypeptidase regulatory-like domain
MALPRVVRSLLFLVVAMLAVPLLAQQTGEVAGRVTGVDGSVLPGVTVEARSNVLPQARVTTTTENGDFRLPVLPPGAYTITFSLAGMQTVTRNVNVLLNQTATVNVSLGLEGVSESITVTAGTTLVDPESTAIKSALGEQEMRELPIGQEYRDLVKLAPAVMYTEDTIRGPSAGGSGQDNVYQFDGVNVTLPLFGTLSAEPSTHDIQQISVIKGGAQAVDFNRAAGFTIDSVSKSGTNEFKGQVSYQIRTDAMTADQKSTVVSLFDEDKSWATVNFGGPILPDRLLFYASYYRPTVDRTNRTNPYGALPDYDSNRNEYFGKLTFTPTSSILLNGSYRTSDREIINASIAPNSAPTTALNEEATQDIAILEASWVVNEKSFATFKFTDYANETGSIPNIEATPFDVGPGAKLDINNLDKYGIISPVPTPITGNTAFNTFIAPFIERYGFIRDGVRTGGGEAGVGSQFNQQDFFRTSAQGGYDFTIGSNISHDIHVGYQWFKDAEDLARVSNGLGVITIPGGRVNCPASACGTATPAFFQAVFTRSALGGARGGNVIHSEYVSHNIEINDNIHWNNWSFNVGFLISNDTLYGQGLREDSSTVSGFVAAPGNKYEMYEIPWEKTFQPRLGVTWAYNGIDNVYASYAKYIPSNSSLPRAASWDRAILGLTTRASFDAQGNFLGQETLQSSTGKLFQEDMDPRYTDEFLLGTGRRINNQTTARAYARYRYSSNFWEDTENDTRVRLAPAGFPKTLYIPNLVAQLNQIRNITTATDRAYVIAQLDGAFTKHYEVTLEGDWNPGKAFLRGSYTWSHYYGNFDQDNTTTVNDQATFIGSSFLADGAGLQVWDNKYGDLRGDRRHILKLMGSYALPWNATAGAYGIYQSGQPWEIWSYEPYQHLPGFTGLNDINRYAEPAGRRRTPAHYQVDLNYTQNVPIAGFNLQFVLDAFNVLNRQTGYNVDPRSHTTSTFGTFRDFYDPRRFQLAVRFDF